MGSDVLGLILPKTASQEGWPEGKCSPPSVVRRRGGGFLPKNDDGVRSGKKLGKISCGGRSEGLVRTI